MSEPLGAHMRNVVGPFVYPVIPTPGQFQYPYGSGIPWNEMSFAFTLPPTEENTRMPVTAVRQPRPVPPLTITPELRSAYRAGVADEGSRPGRGPLLIDSQVDERLQYRHQVENVREMDIVLTMTPAHAQLIREVLFRTGTANVTSRWCIDDLSHALDDSGITPLPGWRGKLPLLVLPQDFDPLAK